MPGLYVHIPFCVKKCKYCDFVSFESCEDKDRYIDALIGEMKSYKGVFCDTVFIGGGTPTSLNAKQLKRVIDAINENFVISEAAEFTVEANPKTLDIEKLALMKKLGVNRISVGVQSFSDIELQKIGRIHNAEDAKNTLKSIKESGFDNFSLDLMSALPSQDFESFKKTLETAVSQTPKHISCYSLILEDGTPLNDEFERGELSLPDEDTERRMYEFACEFLEKNGYRQYEISNFAIAGFESRHNIKYWQCEEYIGLGLAAHSYYNGMRYSNTSDLNRYINGNYSSGEKEVLTLADRVEEFAIMGLRMTKGISKNEFSKRFGMDIYEVYGAEIERFEKIGFLVDDGDNIFLSRSGISVSNSIMCEFAVCNLRNND